MRLGIVSFFMILGFGLLNDLASYLKAEDMSFLYCAVLFCQVFYVFVFFPFILVFYARYCGYIAGKKNQDL